MIPHSTSSRNLHSTIITLTVSCAFILTALFLGLFHPVNAQTQTIQDGDLIRAQGTDDIYIVKLINNKQFKRLIINPDIFDSYGHLEWSNVQDVSQITIDSYQTSNLVQRTGDSTIYRVFPDGDSGSKAQVTLPTNQFQSAGIDTDSIYTINTNEFNLYRTIDPITTPEEYTEEEQTPTPPIIIPDDGGPQTIQDGDLIRATGTQDIYIVKIINNKQFKRLIINPDIFDSYGHLEWSNVQDVPASTLNQYQTSNLVQRTGDSTIYRVFPDGDSGSKAQVTLPTNQFQSAGIDTDSIYTINTNEFNLYRTIEPITTPEEYTTPTPEPEIPEEEPTEPETPIVVPQPPSLPGVISIITDDKVRPPSQLNATTQTLDTLTIEWSRVQDANQGYTIQWCTGNCNPDREWSNTHTITERDTTTHTIENLTLQTTYKIRIKALKTQTRQSIYRTITYTMVLPKPTNLTTTSHTTTSITLNWEQVQGATQGYEIQHKTPTDQNWSNPITATSTETSKQINSLTSGTTYQIRIRALRTNTPDNIPSEYSTTTTTTTPEAPTNPTTTNHTTNAVSLSWTAPTGDNLTYEIEYCSSLANCPTATPQGVWTSPKTLRSNATSITVPQLTQATEYNVRVRATKTTNNTTTNSDWVATSFITKPQAPTGVSITPALASITVEWEQVQGATSYNIHYCTGTCTQETQESTTTPTNRWKTGLTATSTETSKQITSLTQGVTYYARVQAIKTLTTPATTLSSNFSTIIQEQTKLGHPASFKDAPTQTSIVLSWTQNSDATAGYKIQWCSTSCPSTGDWAGTHTITSSSTTTYTIPTLAKATTYQVRIRSVRTATPNIESAWHTITTSTQTDAPTNLQMSNQQTTSATISWNTVTSATSYQITYCIHHATTCPTSGTGTDWTNATPQTTTSTTLNLTQLTASTQYNIQVKAQRLTTFSDGTTTSFITKPQAPTSFTNSAKTPTTATFTWNASTGADGGYEIQYCQAHQTDCQANGQGSRWTTNPADANGGTIAITGQATATRQITNLATNNQYRFRIRSKKTLSSPSNTQYSDWTNSTDVSLTFNPPTNFRTTAQTKNSITLSWTNNTNATSGYEIQYCYGGACTGTEAESSNTTDTNKWIKSSSFNPAAGATSQTISSLSSGTTHKLRIRSLRPSNITSTWDTIETTTDPAPPTALNFSSHTANSVSFSWTASTGANRDYDIEYCSTLVNCPVATPQASWTTTTTTTDSSSPASLTSLSTATQYNIRIRATKRLSSTDYTSEWIATSFITKPQTPSIDSTTVSATSITVNWTAITGANGGYEVQYCKVHASTCQANGTGSDWTTDPADATGGTVAETSQSTTQTTITGLTTNSEYRVRIRSKKTLATPSDTQYSDWTNSQNATPELSYPANFETNAQTTTSVTVQWTQNTDATGGYIVQYCTASSTNCDQAGTGSDWTSTTTAGQKGQVAETATATTSTTISSLNSGITYRARIQSIQTTPSAQSPWSTPIQITTLPVAPTPTSSSKTTTAFTVNWTKPTGTKTGAGAFEYSYCQHHATNCTTTGTGSSYPTNTTAPDTKLQETITGRTPATQYNFRIRAVKTLNATDYKSPWATISILTNPPTPTLTFGSRTTTAITVNWTAITGANNGYRVEYCKSSANCDTAQTGSDWGGAQTNTATKGSTDISTQATISTQFTSLTTDSTYLFRIASKAEGSSNTITSQSSWSSTFTAIPTANPSPPTALTAGTATTTTIPLTWTAPATVPSGGYQVQHCEQSANCNSNGQGSDWNKTDNIVDVTSGTSHTLASLAQGRSHNIRIRSVKTSTPDAPSAWTTSIQARTTVSTPTNLQASTGANNNSLSVSWTAVTGATSYKTRICAQDCSTGTNWREESQTTTSPTLSNLVAGTSYQVQVRTIAVAGLIESPWTSSDTQSTSGTQPTVSTASISLITPDNTQVTVNWTAVAGVSGYQVQHCASGANCGANGVGSDWTSATITPKANQSSTSVAVPSLTNGTTYRFRLRTYASYSSPQPPMTLYSSWSNTSDQTPATAVAPSAPTALSATPASRTSISMSWTISASIGNGLATGYDIQRCTGSNCGDSGSGWANATTVPSTLTRTTASATVTGLSANTEYKVRIRATNAAGNSAWVTSSSVTTAVLANPSGYGTTFVTPEEIRVEWTALSTATGGYDVQYKTASASSWTSITRSSATALKETITGLTNGTTYNIRMRAKTTSNTYSGWQQVNQGAGNGGRNNPTLPALTSCSAQGGGEYDCEIEMTNLQHDTDFVEFGRCFQVTSDGSQGSDCTISNIARLVPGSNNKTSTAVTVTGTTGQKVRGRMSARTCKGGVGANEGAKEGTVANKQYCSARVYNTITVNLN